MSSRRQRIALGDSWVVEEDEDNENSQDLSEEDYQEHQELPRRRSPRKSRASSTRSPEPEFVMPPLDRDTLTASLGDLSGGSRNRKSNLGRETRRSSRQREAGGGPVTQARTTTYQQDFVNQSSIPRAKSSQLEPDSSSFQDIMDIVVQHLGILASSAYAIFGKALKILQTPLAYMVAVGLLLSLGILVRNIVTSSLYASLSTVCWVPGSAYVLPFCTAYPSSAGGAYSGPIEFDPAMKIQSKFEEVLEATAGNAGLPLEMKRGEASIRDLRQLVKYSHLPAKDELGFEFDGFIETAREASSDLQKFNGHVGRAVDRVISITRWTSRVLDDIRTAEKDRGLISGYLYDTVLAPFQSVKFTENRLTDQYVQHTKLVEEEIKILIEEAQSMIRILYNLEDRLDVIGGIGHRDSEETQKKKTQILSELWTMVGGNRGKLNNMDRQLGLLQQVTVYQNNALGYVQGTLLRLQEMHTEIEVLREQVGVPRVMKDTGYDPIPLAVHIENIESAVQRLDNTRQNTRKLENERIKNTIERGRRPPDENLIGS